MRCISTRISSTMSTARPSVLPRSSCSRSIRSIQQAQQCKSNTSSSRRACVKVQASASPQQGSGLAPELKASIDQLVADNTILVFMKGNRQVRGNILRMYLVKVCRSFMLLRNLLFEYEDVLPERSVMILHFTPSVSQSSSCCSDKQGFLPVSTIFIPPKVLS